MLDGKSSGYDLLNRTYFTTPAFSSIFSNFHLNCTWLTLGSNIFECSRNHLQAVEHILHSVIFFGKFDMLEAL